MYISTSYKYMFNNVGFDNNTRLLGFCISDVFRIFIFYVLLLEESSFEFYMIFQK